MQFLLVTLLQLIITALSYTAFAEPPSYSCSQVRLADTGWTDVSATTAVAITLLQQQGYSPKVSLLSMPVTFKGLSNGSLDVFLGNWMPTQEADIRPYLDDHSVVQLAPNLQGAQFTLAVPDYVYEAGVHGLADLASHIEQFDRRIYGIEPGNDGNRQILQMIADNAFDLGHFSLVESSEQGMLMTVKNAVREKSWIVFLGWKPHPMNTLFKLHYLTSDSAYFGHHSGMSTVYTVTRQGFAETCPKLNQFFEHLTFTVEDENILMKHILVDHLTPTEAAQRFLKEHPDFVQKALAYLPALSRRALPSTAKSTTPLTNKLTQNKIPLGHWAQEGVENINSHFSKEFNSFSDHIEDAIRLTMEMLGKISPPLLCALLTLLVWLVRRSWRLTIGTLAALLVIINLGLWLATLETLLLIIIATVFSVMLGVPLGIYFGHRPWLYRWCSPLLDLMQTIPTFVYLIPTLMLFGLGIVPGLISTIIFAMPAPIRLTYLGILQVPTDLLEAAQAFGANKRQRLWLVELPAAKTTILEGASQCIMLSLSMVVVAALVGAGGLGVPIVRALNTVDIGLGFDAGLAIVMMAILLDRIVRFKRTPKNMPKDSP